MNTKQCKSCHGDIKLAAKKCEHCGTDQRNWFGRHPILTVLLIIFVGIPLLSTIINTASKKTPDVEQKVTVSPEVLAQNKQEFETLKTKFTYEDDEFNDMGWYSSKDQTSYSRNSIRIMINNEGYAYLISQYYGNDWIFHTNMQARIGETVYTSTTIPTFDDHNYRDVSGDGHVYEQVSYSGTKDNGILKAIANSGDQEVKVRLTGDQLSKDFVLSKVDKQAIIDGYRLAQLLKVINSASPQQ